MEKSRSLLVRLGVSAKRSALGLAQAGADVAVSDLPIRRQLADGVQRRIEQMGRRCVNYTLDVNALKAISRTIDQVVKRATVGFQNPPHPIWHLSTICPREAARGERTRRPPNSIAVSFYCIPIATSRRK